MSWYWECRCSLRLHGRWNCIALPHQYRLHTPHIWEGKTEPSSITSRCCKNGFSLCRFCEYTFGSERHNYKLTSQCCFSVLASTCFAINRFSLHNHALLHVSIVQPNLFWTLSCFIEIKVRRTTVKVFPPPSLPPSSLPSFPHQELVLFLLNLVCYVYMVSLRGARCCVHVTCSQMLQVASKGDHHNHAGSCVL